MKETLMLYFGGLAFGLGAVTAFAAILSLLVILFG